MSNRGASSRGGVEDPLAPQPGPSRPANGRHELLSKRKASDEEGIEGTNKRAKSSQLIAPTGKPKTFKGERKAGGLIINPILPPSSAPSASHSDMTPLPRPPSTQRSSYLRQQPSDKLKIVKPDSSAVNGPVAVRKDNGKGKEREIVGSTRQDLEVDEDVRRMDEERERLRARDVQMHSESDYFNTPLLREKSVIRRQTELGFGGPPPMSDCTTSIDSTQPIPVRDTPIIDRNRAMRGEPVKRRSSATMRGKRASSSFENTGVIPKPHPSVPTSNFHKHIDQGLPEAHRTRHLLVWCVARTSVPPGRSLSASSRVKNSSLPPLTAEGADVLLEVQKEMQRMLMEQEIDISFSSRMEEDAAKVKVKEHEQNVKNRKREDDFMRHIERCKQEDTAWSAVIQTYNARQASVVEALSRQGSHSSLSEEWMPMDVSDPLHDRELLGAELARKCKEIASRKRGRSPLTIRMVEVENKADRVQSSLHISDQLLKRTTRHLNKRFEGIAIALATRSQPPVQPDDISTLARLTSTNSITQSATGLGAPPDALSVLRALARTDMDRPQREVGDAARRAAREVQRLNVTPGKNPVNGTTAAERRITAVAAPTPRRTPGTPRRAGSRSKSGVVESS